LHVSAVTSIPAVGKLVGRDEININMYLSSPTPLFPSGGRGGAQRVALRQWLGGPRTGPLG
jgi:hypothetical protein